MQEIEHLNGGLRSVNYHIINRFQKNTSIQMTWNSTISCLNPLLLIRDGHITPVSAKDHETNCKMQNATSWQEKGMLFYLVHHSPYLNKGRTTITPQTIKKPVLRNVRIHRKLERTLAAHSTQYTHQEQHHQERPI